MEDPRERFETGPGEADVEISDLPEAEATRPGWRTWLAGRALASQEALRRHPRRWRWLSIASIVVLALVMLGFAISNLALLLRPHPSKAALIFALPTRPAFDPYAYPHSSLPNRLYQNHQGNITVLAWSPDGERLAAGGQDNTVVVWDLLSGSHLVYRGHRNVITGLTWSPDGQEVASASTDGTIQVWNAATAHLLFSRLAASAVHSLAWSPDGHYLAYGDESGAITLFDLRLKRPAGVLVGHLSAAQTLAWSPDSQLLASGGFDFTVRVWQVSQFKELFHYSHGDVVSSIAWSPNGGWLASGSYDTTVQVWQVTNHTRPSYIYQYHKDSVYGISWSPDGTRIASASRDGTIQVWQALTGAHLSTYFASATCVSWAPDGQTLAVGEKNGAVALWYVTQ